MFASLSHMRMSIWEALSHFSGLREYEAALFDPAGAVLDPDMPLMQHALQVCVHGRGEGQTGGTSARVPAWFWCAGACACCASLWQGRKELSACCCVGVLKRTDRI